MNWLLNSWILMPLRLAVAIVMFPWGVWLSRGSYDSWLETLKSTTLTSWGFIWYGPRFFYTI